MGKRFGILLVGCVTIALLAITGYWLLFSTFMAYDDEGYILISLKNYSANGGLYTEVFSQYGPFLYFFHDLGHRLFGYEFTNTNGRLFTLLCWIAVVGAAGDLVWRHTRSAALYVFTVGLTFFHLRLMVSEPTHPGGLIAALVAIGAWSGPYLINRNRMFFLAVITGMIGAALALTKINVGGFFLIATGAWFAVQLQNLRHARMAALSAGGVMFLLPFALMHAQLGSQSNYLFLELSISASIPMLAVAWRNRHPLTGWINGAQGVSAIIFFGSVILIPVCLRGTTAGELWDGVLLAPLRHPEIYHLPPAWKPGAAVVGGASLLLAAVMYQRDLASLRWLVVALRLVLAFGYGLACLEWIPLSNLSFTMSYLIPLAWIFALRITSKEDAQSRPDPALWLGLLLILQYLHAYPVAGTQIAWGTFLIVPLMAMGLYDTQQFIATRSRAVFPVAISLACLAFGIGGVGRLVSLGRHFYYGRSSLGLDGAQDIRLPERFGSALRVLCLNASVHGDLLFSIPGMYSFNGWTGLPTPTRANTTHWFSLLSVAQQQAIIASMEKSVRPVCIAQRRVLDYLQENNFPVVGALHDYLQENFECVLKLEEYEFWVRRGRTIARLGTAEFLKLQKPTPGLAPGNLALTVSVAPGRKITTIEVATLEEKPRVLMRWEESTGPLWSTPINVDGKAQAVPPHFAWNQALPPLVRLNLPLQTTEVFDRLDVIIHARDADGTIVAEARFTD